MVSSIAIATSAATAHKPTQAASAAQKFKTSLTQAKGAVTHLAKGIHKPQAVGGTFAAITQNMVKAEHSLNRLTQVASRVHRLEPAQLLSLQTQAYRANQTLDLGSRLVEKSVSGVKQVLQTNV